jgi:hypothetical protein
MPTVHTLPHRVVTAALATALISAGPAPAHSDAPIDAPIEARLSALKLERARAGSTVIIEPMVAEIDNGVIRVRADDDGQFDIARDGYYQRWRYFVPLTADPWSSFAVAQVIADGVTSTHSLRDLTPTLPSRVVNGAIETVWHLPSTRITQTLKPVSNAYTMRDDTVLIQYAFGNMGARPVRAGIRLMLDVYNLDGNADHHLEFDESLLLVGHPMIYSTLDAAKLHGTQFHIVGGDDRDNFAASSGYWDGPGLTRPDRVQFGSWSSDESWEHTIYGESLLGDNALYLYWNTRDVQPVTEQKVAFTFGVSPGQFDSVLAVYAPAIVTPGSGAFSIAIWEPYPLRSESGNHVRLRLELPQALRAADGQTLDYGIDVDLRARGYEWRVLPIDDRVRGSFPITITAYDSALQTPINTVTHTIRISPMWRMHLPAISAAIE